MSLPGWFVAAALYVALSRFLHRAIPTGDAGGATAT